MHIRGFVVAVVLAAVAPLAARGAAEIVVGEYGSMTGSQATFGQSTHKGIALAVAEANARGGVNGRPVKLTTVDDAGQPQQAKSAVIRLVEQDHAAAILGEVASGLSLAGGAEAQQRGVPMISPSSTAESVTRIGDMVSRVCFTDTFQGQVDARFAVEQLKLKRGAILYNKGQPYSTGLRRDFLVAFGKLGGKAVAQPSYGEGDTDFSSQLTTIKDANPEFVYLPGYYTDVVNIAVQARQLGIACPFIGSDGWASDQLRNAKSALDGSYFSDHYAKEDKRPEVTRFQSAFRQANGGEEPDSMAATGYDAAMLLFDAMARAKSLGGADLAAAINSTKGFKGVTGQITIDEHRNAKKGMVMQVVRGGNYSFFSRVEPPK